MDALFQTVARLANGTFHVPRPLRAGYRHNEFTHCVEGDRNAGAEALNDSSIKTDKKKTDKKIRGKERTGRKRLRTG